jgi:3-hydroxyisobutyrate dehydrogenase-like beta-hydroxyacid dehydrogenase
MTDGATGSTSGMIGLGNMGGRIARRIRDAGLPIGGFDVDTAHAEAAEIDLAASISELVGAVDVVFLSLPES